MVYKVKKMKSHRIGSSTRFQSNTKVKWSARTGHPNTMYKKAIKHKRCNVLYFLCKRVNSIGGVTEKVAPSIEFTHLYGHKGGLCGNARLGEPWYLLFVLVQIINSMIYIMSV